MTESLPAQTNRQISVPAGHRRVEPAIGQRAARALAAEWLRHPRPRTGLIIDAGPGCAVLGEVLADLGKDDTLTVVGRSGLDAVPGTVAPVRVVGSLADADPAEVVIMARPLTGTGESARTLLAAAAAKTAPGGVLSACGPVRRGAMDGAGDELERQAAFYGVGTDLVLRNTPPVRVHRLRYTAADPGVAERLAPAYRPSSVPVTATMHIDSSGVVAAGALVGLAAAARVTRRRSRVWLLPALAALPVAAFFRDPERTPPDDPAAILAASDGTVLSVEHIDDDRFGSPTAWLRIATFLSLFDAHINRSPVAGRVADHFVETGGFAPAMKPAAEHNVAAYTVLDTVHGRVVVAQRTGLVARRIVQRAPAGALLARGERLGLIRFGSRTDVYLPAGAVEPRVAANQRIRAGSTVIARWR